MLPAAALLLAAMSSGSTSDMAAQFRQTCLAASSFDGLTTLLGTSGWKAFSSPTQSQMARVVAAVAPMLDAQGRSSDYTVYALDTGGHHLELALSKTRKPLADGHFLVGCGLYDLNASAPVDDATISALAGGAVPLTSVVSDIQIKKWDNIFGAGSEMRAVFIPAGSAIGPQLGFTGMMLGVSFPDGVK